MFWLPMYLFELAQNEYIHMQNILCQHINVRYHSLFIVQSILHLQFLNAFFFTCLFPSIFCMSAAFVAVVVVVVIIVVMFLSTHLLYRLYTGGRGGH